MTAVEIWLHALDLLRPPFCFQETVILRSIQRIEDVSDEVVRRRLEAEKVVLNGADITLHNDVPPWVEACCIAAVHIGDRTLDWRGFLLLLERDTRTREAIDTLARLRESTSRETSKEICDLITEFKRKCEEAPVMRRMRQRQTARTRRLSGQGPGSHRRPNDKAFLAEAMPPKTRRR